MRKALIFLACIVFAIMISRTAFAYQIFSYNPNFDSNISGVSVYNEVNQTLNYSGTCDVKTGCLNMSSDGSYSSIYLYTIGSDDSHQQWTNATAMGAYDDTTHFLRHVLPKNKQGIVVFSYYFNNSPENFFQYLAVVDADTSVILGNFTLDLTPNVWHTATIIVPASTSDRNVRVFATFRWNNTPSTLMVDKFWFYTEDVNEYRIDFSGNINAELTRYCGAGTVVDTDIGGDHDGLFNNTSFAFGTDINGINCGFVRLNNLIVARRWDYLLPSNYICDVNWFYWTPDLFFVKSTYSDLFLGFFESVTRTHVKLTVLNSGTAYGSNSQLIYGDFGNTTVQIDSFTHNYSTAFRQIISLVNNPNISISNQNPAGDIFRYSTICAGLYERGSPWHPFFTSNIQVDNTGWSCYYDTNTEFFVTSGGEQVNSHYCGECGCAGDGFGYRCVQGANHWECHNAFEAWHYDDACANDLQLVCNIRCESGACVGEQICADNSDCDNYCDGSTLHYNPYCDLSTYTCRWYSNQNCTYGCNSYLGACNEQPPEPPVFQNQTVQGVLSEITGGVLGFLSGSGGSIFKFLFFLFVVVVIIALFGLVGYIVKKAFGG
jgi:hypothetical protein